MSCNHYSTHFIVALACEAKPVIHYYGLKRCMDETAYPVFRNQDMTLTVSGVGKVAAAGAVAYTQGRYGNNQAAIWLNIGIAGHANINVGDCRIAHKITDQETNRHWYPSFVFSAPCETAEITTVCKPEPDYPHLCLYEMEAAGFFATASRFASLELIHAIKVISDNRSTPTTTLNEKAITHLIENQLNAINTLKHELLMIRQHSVIATNESIAGFQSNWNFTTHQLMQLGTLLSQWQSLSANTLPNTDTIDHLNSPKQVIGWLKTQVSNLPISF
jgi:hypothetical protein